MAVAGVPPIGTPPARRGGAWLPLALAALGLVLIVATVVVTRGAGSDSSSTGGEVFLEAAASTGQSPFTEPVDPEPTTTAAPSTTTAPTTTVAPTVAPVTVATRPTSGVAPPPGSPPYGGSGDDRVCDREQLITFLTANPERGRAWAGVLGVAYEQVPAYVRSLTPTVLLYDTRVTNHGFANGRATSLQSVLQAGTAVLVDAAGNPVVRCRCGNPLLAPAPIPAPVYTGTPWPGFSPTTVVSVNNGVTVTVVVETHTIVTSPPTTPSAPTTGGPTTGGPTSIGPTTSATTPTTGGGPVSTDATGGGTNADIEGLLAVLADCAPNATVEVLEILADPELPGTFTVRVVIDGTEMTIVYTKGTGGIMDGDPAAAAFLQGCGVVG